MFRTDLFLPNSEHDEQRSLFQWAAHKAMQIPLLHNIFAIPNGGWRNHGVATRMKQAGLRRGVPDLFIAAPVAGRPGLFIEMKRPDGGQTSPDQRDWIQRLRSAGYVVDICKSCDEAIEAILHYFAREVGVQALADHSSPAASSPHLVIA